MPPSTTPGAAALGLRLTPHLKIAIFFQRCGRTFTVLRSLGLWSGGRSPNPGLSPFSFACGHGEAEPRLTYGGEAAANVALFAWELHGLLA
jgi:hypothetical protein